ncbi:hypothetical protein NQ315_005167 [Exocentrus adspersus]|uniref:Uncharacterized protein n=1 Tax=Exocentrus adspersus TaxID=1586481 RepID=A0AAV8VU06_9CUCU|nr:hypothetical protein NQ315_005167 [Exocentrus adspersus]
MDDWMIGLDDVMHNARVTCYASNNTKQIKNRKEIYSKMNPTKVDEGIFPSTRSSFYKQLFLTRRFVVYPSLKSELPGAQFPPQKRK